LGKLEEIYQILENCVGCEDLGNWGDVHVFCWVVVRVHHGHGDGVGWGEVEEEIYYFEGYLTVSTIRVIIDVLWEIVNERGFWVFTFEFLVVGTEEEDGH
jgi:hypothetical protein